MAALIQAWGNAPGKMVFPETKRYKRESGMAVALAGSESHFQRCLCVNNFTWGVAPGSC
jgi:hypothetical protein